MKKNKVKDIFLENLRTVPIVEISAKKAEVSRKSIYQWRKSDKKFAIEMDEAMSEGVDYINDMSEGQLLNLIKCESWPALAFWLKTRHPKFKDKIEISTATKDDGSLTPEQEAVVRKALSMASFSKTNLNQNGK